jgi:hypothetical protein
LQPLDRSFFKPLKTFWQQTINNWIHSNPGWKATRLQFGKLLTAAWNQAATIGNGSTGFSACGIYPCDPQKIPDHAFAISDGAVDESNSTAAVEEAVNIRNRRYLSTFHPLTRRLLRLQVPLLLLVDTHISKISALSHW